MKRIRLFQRTVFDEVIAALKQLVVGSVFVGEESQDDRSEQGDAPAGRNVAAVASAERRVDQVDRLRVGNFRVEINVFVTAPIYLERTQKPNRKEKKKTSR